MQAVGTALRATISSGSRRGGLPMVRRWLARAILVGLLFAGPWIGVALLEPEHAATNGAVRLVEAEVRQHEDLHYAIHSALGRVFSLCPCTRGLAETQFRKGSFHYRR